MSLDTSLHRPNVMINYVSGGMSSPLAMPI